MGIKYRIIALSIGLMVFSTVTQSQTNKALPYKSNSLTIEERVNDLLNRMTLEEKVNQLRSEYGRFTLEDIKNKDKLAQWAVNMPGMMQPDKIDLKLDITVRNAIQKYALEETRLGIPMLFVDEALHGAAKEKATSFPQAIALGSTWNPELIEEIFTVTAHELRSRGSHFVLSPVVDVSRDPRWVRVEECYGEDPFLAGKMGAAAVRGLQGSSNGTIKNNHVGATLKHFVGHGQKEGGRNKAPANISNRILRDLHIEPFRIAIRESTPYGIMPSYNEVDGVPMHMNTFFLRNILQDELGFRGMVVSDYLGINEIKDLHWISPGNKASAQLAFNAGVEYDLPDGSCFKYLPELVREDKVSEEAINKAVKKILRLKFELGLFDDPYVKEKDAVKVSLEESHKELAGKAAQESIILLKNENQILPLDKEKYKKIAVIGPNANDTRIGEYSGIPYYKVTILDGIKNKFENKCQILYSEGCKITTNHTPDSRETWFKPIDDNTFPVVGDNLKSIAKAAEVAKQADVIILVIGENEMICREAFAPPSTGDNSILDLYSEQNELFDAMYQTGKPVVVCLMHGRPLTINNIAEKANAILDLWYAGQETGNAVADILFGDINPSGKLTVTYPKSVGQLPVHYNRKPTSARNYVKETFGWIYPFGFGLSYSTFKYQNAKLSKNKITVNESVEFSCEVTNTSNKEGKEVVQLYIHDELASVTRPVKELKGFQKISLAPGETKQVIFKVDKSALEFWSINNRYEVEPGNFTLMIGSSSENIHFRELITVY